MLVAVLATYTGRELPMPMKVLFRTSRKVPLELYQAEAVEVVLLLMAAVL
jgi:hypothetical protein